LEIFYYEVEGGAPASFLLILFFDQLFLLEGRLQERP